MIFLLIIKIVNNNELEYKNKIFFVEFMCYVLCFASSKVIYFTVG